MTKKILTKHPKRKQGTNIDKDKYDAMRGAIVDALREEGVMTFQDLNQAVHDRLEGNFEGSIGWYYTTVKLDLEAREVIERVDESSPQRLRLIA